MDSTLEAKGTVTSLKLAKTLGLRVHLISKMPKLEFYHELGMCAAFVYMPSVKESFCRVAVEAILLGIPAVYTNHRVASSKESWFGGDPSTVEKHLIEGTQNILENIAECLRT